MQIRHNNGDRKIFSKIFRQR
jgi:hypothetical protein